jgi:hypothetical protein
VKNTEQYGPTHLIEPYVERRARTATARKAGIEREAAKLRAAYERLRLPVPSILIPRDEPATPKAKTPIKATAPKRRDRPKPHPARLAAIAAGRKTYKGSPCKRGHSGLRFVAQSDCVECARLRHRGRLH